MFPWQRANPIKYIDFICQYCGQVQQMSGDKLILCTCPGAVKARCESRNFLNKPDIPMHEIRKMRKIDR